MLNVDIKISRSSVLKTKVFNGLYIHLTFPIFHWYVNFYFSWIALLLSPKPDLTHYLVKLDEMKYCFCFQDWLFSDLFCRNSGFNEQIKKKLGSNEQIKNGQSIFWGNFSSCRKGGIWEIFGPKRNIELFSKSLPDYKHWKVDNWRFRIFKENFYCAKMSQFLSQNQQFWIFLEIWPLDFCAIVHDGRH